MMIMKIHALQNYAKYDAYIVRLKFNIINNIVCANFDKNMNI